MLFFLLLFVGVPAGLGLACGLLGFALGRSGVRAEGPARLRGVAALLGAAAAFLYTWGVLHVAGSVLEAEDGGASSSPLPPCRVPGEWERALKVVDYSVDVVPLRFVCETTDGDGFAAGVPGYVNPGVAGLVLVAVGCAVGPEVRAEFRRRTGAAGRSGA